MTVNVWPAPNSSQGFHLQLAQWWNKWLGATPAVLLASEGRACKEHFQAKYPSWRFWTADLHQYRDQADFVVDFCSPRFTPTQFGLLRFDIIICQSMLEHVYAPFVAVRNMVELMAPGGWLIIHTHSPGFEYHGFPRDYCRFFPDWFQDLPKYLPVTLDGFTKDPPGNLLAKLRKKAE
jgi:SAM-dependent methyltransferase